MLSSSPITRKPVGSEVRISGTNFQQHDAADTSPAELLLHSSPNEIADRKRLKTISNRHRQSTSTTSKLFTESWGLELLGCILAAIAMIGVVVTLKIYDNKSLSHWHFPIGLNTLVAVLSQIAQMALMVPITSCISQLKWLWFINSKVPQRLTDFDAFDAASRSFYGSFILIIKTHARHLVSLGAALTVVALAFQPFTQQSISFLQRSTPSASATIPYISNLTGDYLVNFANSVPLSFWAAVYNAFATPYLSPSNVTASCPSGNCTFDTYHSLGLCALPGVNLTHQIIATPISQDVDCSISPNWSGVWPLPDCTYKLPNGVMLNTENFILNVTSVTPPSWGNPISTTDSIAYPEFYNAMPVDFFVTYISHNTGHIVAMEYAICFCGQTYNSSVTRGQTLTTIMSTWNTILSVNQNLYNGWVAIEGPVVFNISQDIIDNMIGASQEIFQGLEFVDIDDYNSFDTQISLANEDISISAQAIATVLAQTGNESAAMDVFMNNLAISLTNSLRTSSAAHQFNGNSSVLEVYVSVNYEWLILPISLVLLTLVFLLATMFKNHRQGVHVWKSSSLAVFGGLGREAREALGTLASVTELGERGEKIHLVMRKGNDGWTMEVMDCKQGKREF